MLVMADPTRVQVSLRPTTYDATKAQVPVSMTTLAAANRRTDDRDDDDDDESPTTRDETRGQPPSLCGHRSEKDNCLCSPLFLRLLRSDAGILAVSSFTEMLLSWIFPPSSSSSSGRMTSSVAALSASVVRVVIDADDEGSLRGWEEPRAEWLPLHRR